MISKSDQHTDEIKRLKKAIQRNATETGNLVAVVANTGSAALLAAITAKEQEAEQLKARLSELERQSTVVDIDEDLIIRAFEYGKELLESGEIPNLRQLINLYVERIVIYPDRIDVSFNLLRGLQVQENGANLDKLNHTSPEALVLTESASRNDIIARDGA